MQSVRADIERLWAKAVHALGVDRFTPEEWKEEYEHFIKCMVSDKEPCIVMNTEAQLREEYDEYLPPALRNNNRPQHTQPTFRTGQQNFPQQQQNAQQQKVQQLQQQQLQKQQQQEQRQQQQLSYQALAKNEDCRYKPYPLNIKNQPTTVVNQALKSPLKDTNALPTSTRIMKKEKSPTLKHEIGDISDFFNNLPQIPTKIGKSLQGRNLTLPASSSKLLDVPLKPAVGQQTENESKPTNRKKRKKH
ncbi:spindle pole body component 97-like [Drosophila grimshawi]|uniref:spindle pole body component 97-like n=1 Tax=Drosophila grimshawi TaxID=7222 RepID=UPI001C9331C6|nr:spindle pole body component 97-like [Drosophila grimshawi]